MRRILICLIMGLTFLGCGSKEERRDDFFANALKFEAEGRIAEARIEARNVIKLDPNHTGAYLLLGRSALKEQNWREAFANYQRATELAPDNVEALLGVGRLYLLSGDAPKAESSANKILSLDPASHDGRLLRVGAMLRAMRFDEARLQLDEVFAKDPGNEDATLALSVIHAEQGRGGEALRVVEDAIPSRPGSRALHFRAASLAADQGLFEAAEGHLLKLKELDPANRGVMVLLAALYERMGDGGRVEGILRELLAAEPESEEARLRLVEYLMRTGKPDEAMAVAGQGPGGPTPKLRLAMTAVQMATGRTAEAEAGLAALAADAAAGPAGLDARLRLSELKLRRGDRDGAMAEVETVLLANPGDARGHAARGRILMLQGRHEEALTELRIALHDNPADIPVVILMAKAQFAIGNGLSGQETLRAALERKPNAAELRLELAAAQERQGNADAALGVLQAAAAYGGMDPRLLFAMGSIEARRGHYDAAEAHFRQAMGFEQARIPALMRIGTLQAARKDWPAARRTFEGILRDQPDAQGAAAMMVGIEREAAGPVAALAWSRSWSEARPQDAWAADLLGRTAMELKEYGQAEAAFIEAGRRDPESSVPLMRLAALKARTGQLDAAIADSRAALMRNPDSVAESVLLGQLLQRAGQHAEAEGIYRRLLERQPGLRTVANNLAYAIASDPAATPQRLAEALSLATTASAEGDPAALDTLGWIHYRLGDRPTALIHLRKAHEALPDDPSVAYHLARVLADEGDPAEARTLLLPLLQRQPDFPEYAEAKALLDSI